MRCEEIRLLKDMPVRKHYSNNSKYFKKKKIGLKFLEMGNSERKSRRYLCRRSALSINNLELNESKCQNHVTTDDRLIIGRFDWRIDFSGNKKFLRSKHRSMEKLTRWWGRNDKAPKHSPPKQWSMWEKYTFLELE